MFINRFYAVHRGRKKGVYRTWAGCLAQVEFFPNAEFKKYDNYEDAAYAVIHGCRGPKRAKQPKKLATDAPLTPFICVDGSCFGNSSIEFQAIENPSGRMLFKQGPFRNGTNNVAEFLGLYETIRYCHLHCINVPIYSDSSVAIGWVKKRRFKTGFSTCPDLITAMEAALTWLNENQITNKILKWETESWGENPADFGRKK